jgi:hypothetical protein
MTRFARKAVAVGGAALLVVALAACSTPSNTPSAYDDATQANFVEGCTATDATGGSVGQGQSPETCQCKYEWFVGNVPYSPDTAGEGYSGDTFTGLQSQMHSNPDSMPTQIADDLAQACGGSSSGTTVVPG